MITLKPRLSEKTYHLSQSTNTYAFNVPIKANKSEIKEAVEKQFKVLVLSVNMMVKPGKVKQSARKRSQPQKGRESDTKKAYVKLKQGDKIPMFEEG